jgi:prepilin-type N-terminal cleavage/methylation domain-containing protein
MMIRSKGKCPDFGKKPRGFTLIELLIVILVMILLTTVGVPAFSRMLRTSRVQQAAQTVLTALWHARSEAMRYRQVVAVFYGDKKENIPAACWASPLTDVLPLPGQINVWTVKQAADDTMGLSLTGIQEVKPHMSEVGLDDGNAHPWYPFRFRERLLNTQPFTFPEGVRVISCVCKQNAFYQRDNKQDAIGEIKRHNSVYTRRGGAVHNNNAGGATYAYNYALVLDEATGEHAVIQTGAWNSGTRPRLLPFSTYWVARVNATALTDLRQLPAALKNYPQDLTNGL